MNICVFAFAGIELRALPSGALWWPDANLLCVSDLHLGKSERMARRGGALLPPYEVADTLGRLEADLSVTAARTVIALGDSFDDLEAAGAADEATLNWINRLQAGRRWVWIAGNHDPAPMDLSGEHLFAYAAGPLTFRHEATDGGSAEVSGHYHPKARLRLRGRSISRPCFLFDDRRVILPAYGTFTGGLRSSDGVLADLMSASAEAILTGPTPARVPMPR